MRTILIVIGLLLGSSGVFAQGKRKAAPAPPVSTDGKVAVPVTPALPGEEDLTARERVERDFLMPVRRKQALSKIESTAVAPANVTARNMEVAQEAEAEVTAKAAEKTGSKSATSARKQTTHRR